MKIVFLIRTLTFGGAERQLVALAKGLHDRGNLVKVVVFYPGGPLESDLEEAGIPVLSLDKRGRWDIIPFVWRAAKTLKLESPDIVHGYLGASNLLSLVLKPFHRGKSVWGVRASGMDSDHSDWLDRLDSWFESHLSGFADLIIANSLSGKMHVISLGFPASKTIVIPNGIDTDRFVPDAESRAKVRAEFGLGDKQLLVGRVGRIDPQKDYPAFIRTAALIAKSRPETRFICVGNGPEERVNELRALADALSIGDRVIWAPARPDMPDVYNAMDLCISTSAFGEGTPNVVAEAMACGVPCIVTDIGDSAIVIGDPNSVVATGSPELLAAKALERLAQIDAGSIDHAALRARTVNSLSMFALISRSESALQALVSGRRSRFRRVRRAHT